MATAKQIAWRKKFAKMAKAGVFRKRRKANSSRGERRLARVERAKDKRFGFDSPERTAAWGKRQRKAGESEHRATARERRIKESERKARESAWRKIARKRRAYNPSPAQLRARRAFAKMAKVRAKAARSKNRKRNVEQGFYDASGFHPIRASRDYDADRADEIHEYPRRRKVIKKKLRKRRRNVEQGYYDQTGFHPIRASRDYDADRADEIHEYPRRKVSRRKKAVPKKRRRNSTWMQRLGRMKKQASRTGYAPPAKRSRSGRAAAVGYSRSSRGRRWYNPKTGKWSYVAPPRKPASRKGRGYLLSTRGNPRKKLGPQLRKPTTWTPEFASKVRRESAKVYREMGIKAGGKAPKRKGLLSRVFGNPRGQHLPGLPAKYQRMYEHVLATSGSKRIAAATVQKQLRRHNPGLFARLFGKKTAAVGARKTQRGRKRVAAVGYRRVQRGRANPRHSTSTYRRALAGHLRRERKAGRRDLAKASLRQWKLQRAIPRKIRNPRRGFNAFRGRPVKHVVKSFAANGTPRDVKECGGLVDMHLRGGKKVRFNPSRARLCYKSNRLHIVGARFRKPNPPGEEDYGEILKVAYVADKPHLESDDRARIYEHRFGEEGGIRPHLVVDAEGLPIISGGTYTIPTEGIRD